MEIGAWSLWSASYFGKEITKKGVTRDSIAKSTGISKGRLPNLLNGQKSFYLEDIRVLCLALDIPFRKFFNDLQKAELSLPVTNMVHLELVAKKRVRKAGTETDEGFDSI